MATEAQSRTRERAAAEARTGTWRWSWSGPPRRPRSTARATWALATRTRSMRAAVDAMRPVLGTVRMNGVVVIGEGEKDEAPMLYNGERVGDGSGPELDIAVDPVDGTTLTAKSLPDAVSIIGVSPRGTMFSPARGVHAEAGRAPGTAAACRS